MRKKKLLTAALCMTLLAASCTVSSDVNRAAGTNLPSVHVQASEEQQEETLQKEKKKDVKKPDKKPQTEAKPTEAPQTETKLPQTETKPTEAPQTETNPPQTETKPTEAPQTETNPPQTETKPTEAPQTETNPPQTETKPTEAPQTETKPQQTETAPSETETKPTEAPQTETNPDGTEPSQTETDSSQTDPTQTETGATEAPQTETLPPQTESETGQETESESESESETESETSEFDSNEELIAHQKIIVPPDIELEFRFTQIEENPAIVKNKEGIFVYESKSSDAREVGELPYYGLCCILEDQSDGWYYIESGNVRGFVKADELLTGEAAWRVRRVKGDDELSSARLLVARAENEAFVYTHTTVKQVLADKVYALASGEVEIREQKKESARTTGRLADGALCYILEDAGKDWVFVESGNARGFVKRGSLLTGSSADKKVAEKGENNMPLAEVLVEPQDNEACYYTLTSVKKASQAALTREAMVNFALQFVGNPYVWGGTSLSTGADCSGFVQSIYANFGYSLPRVAEDQSQYGMQIPVESAEPGDLIFYARNGYVYHVSMYIGDGQVVHAAGRKVGTIVSGINGNAVWATRIIQD